MPERRDLLTHARAMRRDPTDAERLLWRILRNGQVAGLKFRRQVPLGPYIADFACFAPKLIVEADGGHHADSTYDDLRDAWFGAQGFKVLRFWNADILERGGEGVVLTLLRETGRS